MVKRDDRLAVLRIRRASRFVVGLVVGLALVLTGCGGGEDASSVDAAESSADEQASPAPVAEPTVTPEPQATSVPEPTVLPEPSATTVPTPASTSTPEPLTAISLDQARAGLVGSNLAALRDGSGDVLFRAFDQPDGEAISEELALSLSFTQAVLVVEGEPSDEWVQVMLSWVHPAGQTAWMPSADMDFVETDSVLEVVRSSGDLRLWHEGEAVWSGTDLTDRERAEQFMPTGHGYVNGNFPASNFGGRNGPEFHPDILGLSFVSIPHESDVDLISPIGIRGVATGEELEPGPEDARGVLIWLDQAEFEELLRLAPLGTRVEILE